MAWVDLVRNVWRGRSGRRGQGLISLSHSAFWKRPGFLTLSTLKLSAPITLESVTSLGT